MHHVGVAFHHHFVGERDLARFRHPAHIVTAQINQHQVLGNFLRVRQQVRFQSLVFLAVGTALARTGDGPNRDRSLLRPGENLRGRAGNMEIAQIQIEHVRRRVQITQCPVQVQRRRLERAAHALGRHHLHHVAGENILAHLLHAGLELVFREFAAEIAFVHRLAVHGMLRLRQGRTQLRLQRIQTLCRLLARIPVTGIHMHHQEQGTAQIIEHHHFFGAHQQDIRHAEHILAGGRTQPRLEIAHAVITEVAHQATVETGQPWDFR